MTMWGGGNHHQQQQQRKSNEDGVVQKRRVGVKWSPTVPTATDGRRYSLKKTLPAPKKSCMRVRTQVDSLATPWLGEERSRRREELPERQKEREKERAEGGDVAGSSASLSKTRSMRMSMSKRRSLVDVFVRRIGSADSAEEPVEDKRASFARDAKSWSSCPNVAAGRKGPGGGLDLPSPPRKDRRGRSVRQMHRESGGMYVPTRHRQLMSVVGGGPASSGATRLSDRKVTFTTIEVREYQQILDVNPAVQAGPAVGLGWEYEVASDVPGTVDEYEAARSSSGGRETYDQTGDSVGTTCAKMSESERTKFLKSKGFTDQEIREAVVATNRARTMRQRTLEDLVNRPEAEARTEQMEEVGKAWRRWICGCCRRGGSAGGKDDIDKLWDEAQKQKR